MSPNNFSSETQLQGEKIEAAVKFSQEKYFKRKKYFRTLLASLFFCVKKKSEHCLPPKKDGKALRTLSNTKFEYNERIWMERSE